jgi:hypothetical protein
MATAPTTLTLRTPDDLPALGKYLRAVRRQAGLAVASNAAPYLGVGVRLLVQLESGTRGKRGVTMGKLLEVLQGLGLELVVRPRSQQIDQLPPVSAIPPEPPKRAPRPTQTRAVAKVAKPTTKTTPKRRSRVKP